MTIMTTTDVHERRKARDREDQARRRAEARAAGEPMGHGLDALVIDGLALMLAGRDMDDPVRLAWTRAMTRAIHARRVKATPAIARRLQARLNISPTLRLAIQERRIEAMEQART